jgi:predicted lactoylglutathione lyase
VLLLDFGISTNPGTPSIFVNLPVRDLERSKAFFAELGYSFNPQFADERAECMVISEDIYTMLSSEPFFKTFTRKEIADAAKTTEVLVALSAESRGKVDEMLLKALAAGANEAREPMEYESMYGRSFEDLAPLSTQSLTILLLRSSCAPAS